MTLYILPQNLYKFQNRLEKMLSKFTVQPTVTYSEPKVMKAVTVESYNKGYDGWGKYIKTVTVIEVDIEDIEMNDWVLVASVFYRDGRISMVSKEYFKDIPEKFGLEYSKCDYCGKMHTSRKDAHIIYNKITNTWMQVGSACINKMFEQGKYFSTFTESLFKYVDISMGCCGLEDFPRWCASIPDHFMQEAINLDDALLMTRKYYTEISSNWQKSWRNRESRCGGTTEWINEFFRDEKNAGSIDSYRDNNFLENCKSYVMNNLDKNNEFDKNIIDTFNAGFVNRYAIYTVFFGMKKYLDSLTTDDWTNIKKNYPIGEKVTLKNLKVVGYTPVESWFGTSNVYVFEDENGTKFTKSFSNPDISDYTNESTELVSFIGKISYYNDNKRMIVINGRISKVK